MFLELELKHSVRLLSLRSHTGESNAPIFTCPFFPGVPDQPDLAETYYSQFDNEFEDEDEDDEDDDDDEAEGTLLATVVGAAGAAAGGDEDDMGDLIQHMETALSKEQTGADSTILVFQTKSFVSSS